VAGESAFKVEGLVAEALPNGTFRVKLGNGHIVLGFVTGKARRNPPGLKPGNRVKLQMSPFDLSQGRIIIETATK
jgi:translation initiation factor IF-1